MGLQDKSHTEQQDINVRWLVDKIDRIHYALCPDEMGTWQIRAEQAAKAAERLKAENAKLRDANKALEEIRRIAESYVSAPPQVRGGVFRHLDKREIKYYHGTPRRKMLLIADDVTARIEEALKD